MTTTSLMMWTNSPEDDDNSLEDDNIDHVDDKNGYEDNDPKDDENNPEDDNIGFEYDDTKR